MSLVTLGNCPPGLFLFKGESLGRRLSFGTTRTTCAAAGSGTRLSPRCAASSMSSSTVSGRSSEAHSLHPLVLSPFSCQP